MTGRALKPYQVKGVDLIMERLSKYKSAFLTLMMGLGKTTMAVTSTYRLYQEWLHQPLPSPPCFYVLCIVPLSTMNDWEAEWKLYGFPVTCFVGPTRRFPTESTASTMSTMSTMRAHVILTTSETLVPRTPKKNKPEQKKKKPSPATVATAAAVSKQHAASFEALMAMKWHMFIVDEAHRFGNICPSFVGSTLVKYSMLKDFQRFYSLCISATPCKQGRDSNTLSLLTLAHCCPAPPPISSRAQPSAYQHLQLYDSGSYSQSIATTFNERRVGHDELIEFKEEMEHIRPDRENFYIVVPYLHSKITPELLTQQIQEQREKGKVYPVVFQPVQRLVSSEETETPAYQECVGLVEDIAEYKARLQALRSSGQFSAQKEQEIKRLSDKLKTSMRLLCVTQQLADADTQPITDEPDQLRARARKSPKYTMLTHLLSTQTNTRLPQTLVFSSSVITLRAYALAMIADGIIPQACGTVFESTLNKKQRSQLVQRYNAGQAPILFISKGCGGTGINLHTTQQVVLLDVDFAQGTDEQAVARAFRLNSVHPVIQVYRFLHAVGDVLFVGMQIRKLYETKSMSWVEKEKHGTLFGDDFQTYAQIAKEAATTKALTATSSVSKTKKQKKKSVPVAVPTATPVATPMAMPTAMLTAIRAQGKEESNRDVIMIDDDSHDPMDTKDTYTDTDTFFARMFAAPPSPPPPLTVTVQTYVPRTKAVLKRKTNPVRGVMHSGARLVNAESFVTRPPTAHARLVPVEALYKRHKSTLYARKEN